MPANITIKELHATTGEYVRKAGRSRSPILVTDRGVPVAILASPSLLKSRRRKRIILPGYEELMGRSIGNDMIDDLNSVREDR